MQKVPSIHHLLKFGYAVILTSLLQFLACNMLVKDLQKVARPKSQLTSFAAARSKIILA